IVLANDGTLPLPADAGRIAVVGPLADDPRGMLGCYTFPVHVGVHHPELDMGIRVATLAEALRAAVPDATLTVERGCGVDASEDSGDAADDEAELAAAVEAARQAQVAVVAL